MTEVDFSLRELPKSEWSTGDYVLVEVIDPVTGAKRIELPDGRMMEAMLDHQLIGALGERYATLEATGTWKEVGDDGIMHALTAAGLLGKLTSKSVFVTEVVEVLYLGHLIVGGKPSKMQDFVPDSPYRPFQIPVVLLVGTSMSAGKTTAGRIIIHQLKKAGLKVVGSKLTGAGRYRDILSFKDAGADFIYDFVDVGLPSSICPPAEYLSALRRLLSLMAATGADAAVIEIGASPLEPYNGDIAIREIKDQIRFTVLCASDPYAVYGVMKSFSLTPDIVSGAASNTLSGRELIGKLCGVKGLNIIDPEVLPELRSILYRKMGVL